MYPYFRFFRLYFGVKSDSSFTIRHESLISFRVGLQDIDIYPELNNGRYFTLCDLARTHLGLKAGLIQILRKNKWSLVMGGASAKYRRRIKLFQKFSIHTEIIHFDHRWFYFHQQFKRSDVIHASFMMRAAVVDSKGFVHPKKIHEALNMDYVEQEMPDWIKVWLESENFRPATD